MVAFARTGLLEKLLFAVVRPSELVILIVARPPLAFCFPLLTFRLFPFSSTFSIQNTAAVVTFEYTLLYRLASCIERS
jgi:hypothetical protein